MSDPQPQIVQDLLRQLDRSLSQPFAPWRLYPQWQAQRQLLQRLRDVLSLWPSVASAPPPLLPATDVALATVRSQLLSPLQADIQQLTEQRQALRAEVAQLEAQRSQLQGQIMQPLIDQVEQLEQFQQRADRVLKGVDQSLQFTFQTLDQDMVAYRRSLTQRFGQLEDLSQQSETIVATLLQRLIEASPSPVMLRADRPELAPGETTTSLLSPILPLSAVGTLESAAAATVPAVPPAAPRSIASLQAILSQLGLTHPSPRSAFPVVGSNDESTGIDAEFTGINDEFTLSEITDLFEPPPPAAEPSVEGVIGSP